MSTILIVDDDVVFLDNLERMLVTAGYTVLRASTGSEAIQVLDRKHREIGLAIVDLALPDVNGFELIGGLSRRANHVKVLATTAIYRDNHLEMAGSLGAHAAIRKPPAGKPLPENEWLPVIKRLIGAPAENRASAARANGGKKDVESSNGPETKQ